MSAEDPPAGPELDALVLERVLGYVRREGAAIPVKPVLLALVGAVLIYCGLWNLKFGAQNWRGIVALILGIAVFAHGVNALLLWSLV